MGDTLGFLKGQLVNFVVRNVKKMVPEYAVLKASWGGFAGYDRYFAQELTNAHLASIGAYNILVPAFDALLAREGGDFPRFYAEVRRLARLPKGEREAELRGLVVAR
jgi:predicted aminopeptidase